MPLNLSAVGTTSEPRERSWDHKDCLLYALGVGAGMEDPTGAELDLTTENSAGVTQRALPTMAVVLPAGGMDFKALGDFDLTKMLHGDQSITLHREIPTQGRLRTTNKVVAIYDKGSAAVVVTEAESVLADSGEPLFTNRASLFMRGEGGFGGDRGPSATRNTTPERAPDASVTYQTRSDQALLYRLNGDRNPLHSDPTFAAKGGFPKPILHGLCTYGFTGRGLLHLLCDSDPGRFRSMDARFTSPVMPGEALTVEAWRTGEGEAAFRTTATDGRVVLDGGVCTYAPA
jgi:acyl dehydratase